MATRFSGEKLRQLRQAVGVSRNRLGVEIDRSYLSIRNYETARTTPPPDVAQRIADVLNLPLAALYVEAPDV